ncbi:MAG: Vps62-related protein [Candidatus Bathyarchaeota archaeon]|nr:Vps62-related protein [Candidatus Bathyarchaeota archaeon]
MPTQNVPVPGSLKSRRYLVLFTVFLCVCLLASPAFMSPVCGQTDTQLAEQYAPVLHFTQGETFYPTNVDYIIESCTLKQRHIGGTPTLVDASPTAASLGSYSSIDLFLDNKLGDAKSIAEDYENQASSMGYHAYARVTQRGTSTIIQYWLFYVYNNGPLNNHQGDIEVIQVFLDSAGNPQTVLLSQHGAGQNAAWNDVEKVDTHPVVYVAQGSHANYFRAYQGKMGIENDVVGSDGKTVMPEELNLVMLGEVNNHPQSQSWLEFKGRWGYWGTEQEVALGQAGPHGPVFNQDGIRWSYPDLYLSTTFTVEGNYFTLAWLVANFLMLFLIYIVVRAAWKSVCIYRIQRKGGLMVKKFLKGHGGIGLMLGIVAILLTVAALFLPWYTITASSQAGPLAQEGGVTLMTMDGVNGLNVNMFVGAASSDSTSGYTSLFATQMPFAIALGAGVILLALDVLGVRSGKSLGLKLMTGAVTLLLPIIIILIFISQLPAFLPFASGLLPTQDIPVQVTTMIQTIASNPIQGTTSTAFPIVGTTTVNWGVGAGIYLFIAAAILRVAGGFLMFKAPKLAPPKTGNTQPQPETTQTPQP